MVKYITLTRPPSTVWCKVHVCDDIR